MRNSPPRFASTLNLKPTNVCFSNNIPQPKFNFYLIFIYNSLTDPVINALIPSGDQSEKLGLTEGLVGGAIKAALSQL